jgi:hypothetical protein
MSTRARAIPKPGLKTSSRMPGTSALVQRKCACDKSSSLVGECEACKKNELPLQRKAVSDQVSSFSVPPVVHEVLRSPGQPLDASVRAFMEPRFGHDFSRVRVHTDARAAESARAVNALAYTVGDDVVFGTNKYASASQNGRGLLAHELAHTIQQRSATGALPSTNPHGIIESSAEAAGRAIAHGGTVSGDLPACGVGLSRAPDVFDDQELARQLQEVTERLKQPDYPGRDRDLVVAEALLAVSKKDEKEEEKEDDIARPRTLSLIGPDPLMEASRVREEQFENERRENAKRIDQENQIYDDRELPSNPEEPAYWGRWTPWLSLPIHIGTETRLVRAWERQTIERPGDQANEHVNVDVSFWIMTRPALRAYLIYVVGSLTEFEEGLVRGNVKAEYGLIPVANGSEVVGYYIESQSAIETSIKYERLYDRHGTILKAHSTGGDVVSEGIGPLVLLLPGVGIRSLASGAATLGRGALTFGRAALATGGRMLGPAARSMALRTGLAIGRAEGGAALAETALRGSGSSAALVEGRSASTIAPQAAEVEITAQAATQTAVQSTLRTGAQTALRSTSRAGAQTPLQSVSTGTRSATDVAARVAGGMIGQSAITPAAKPSRVASPLKAAALPKAKRTGTQVQPKSPKTPKTKTPKASPDPKQTKAQEKAQKQAKYNDNLDRRIARVRNELSEARQRTVEYKGARAAAGESEKGGPSKGMWNKEEELYVLERARAYPDRTLLEQVSFVGVKGVDGKVTPADEIAGEGRTLDFLEIDGAKVLGAEVKSKAEIVHSVEDLRKPGMGGDYKTTSKVGQQRGKETSIVTEAQDRGGRLVFKGKDVRTGEDYTIEVDPKSYGSTVVAYDQIMPN